MNVHIYNSLVKSTVFCNFVKQIFCVTNNSSYTMRCTFVFMLNVVLFISNGLSLANILVMPYAHAYNTVSSNVTSA